jgi:hypothetical protein
VGKKYVHWYGKQLGEGRNRETQTEECRSTAEFIKNIKEI